MLGYRVTVVEKKSPNYQVLDDYAVFFGIIGSSSRELFRVLWPPKELLT